MTFRQRASERLVLNPDVQIVPIREYAADVRERIGGNATDFVLSDSTSRMTSQRVDQDAAALLRQFLRPNRIVDAILEHSRELHRGPASTLDDVYPFLTAMCEAGILRDPRSPEPPKLGTAPALGDVFEGYRIRACASSLAETCVYQAEAPDGSLVAIKYVRSGADASVSGNLAREVAVLRYLAQKGCRCVPHIHTSDLNRADPYACMDWIEGTSLYELTRDAPMPLARRARLVKALIAAYSELHGAGVIHGDVHPGNVLVFGSAIRLVDFGGARRIGAHDRFDRIGLVPYYEPEVAKALFTGKAVPLPTPLGEQYAVASLAYTVLAGTPCLTLSLETETALRQIATESPRSFSSVGMAWPKVETVLSRALAKHPSDRYPSFASFRCSLDRALSTRVPPQPRTDASGAPSRRRIPSRGTWRSYVRTNLLEKYGLSSDTLASGLRHGPTASIYGGAAGIGYALTRAACLLGDTAALAAADVWISRALAEKSGSRAFRDGSVATGAETGPRALFHSETGLHVVDALVRRACNDPEGAARSVQAFLDSVPASMQRLGRKGRQPFALDTTNGAPSLLLGAALLVPVCVACDEELRQPLQCLGQDLCRVVIDQFRAADVGDGLLGFAHGRTGAVYASLRWAEASGQKPPKNLGDEVDGLANRARRDRGGRSWPVAADGQGPAWTGWCNGSAGHLLTLIVSARVLGRSQDLELAEAVGNHVWQARGQSGPTLCCGGAGEALALFELARATGDQEWVERGRRILARAVLSAPEVSSAQGLFRGDVGIALAVLEGEEPATSCWPVCAGLW